MRNASHEGIEPQANDKVDSQVVGSALTGPQLPPEGHEPDYRFTLANERTFLAWVRTALALLAGAVGLMHFAKPLTGLDPDKLFGIVLASAGLVAIIYATWRWHSVQRAMSHDAPLPGGTAIWFLSGLIILTGSLAGITALVTGGLV
ncbi:YidH family protein [Martelella sp. AMO21009]